MEIEEKCQYFLWDFLVNKKNNKKTSYLELCVNSFALFSVQKIIITSTVKSAIIINLIVNKEVL